MSLSFKKQTEEEVLQLMPLGTYNYQVATAVSGLSKAGNEMITLSLVVWDNAGKEHYIKDYLMEKLMFKLKHFCDSCGLEEKYESESLSAEDCMNRSGKCKIKIDEGSGGYGPKNVVQDYVPASAESSVPAAVKAAEPFVDDSLDIPF